MFDSGSESDEPVVVASKRLRSRCVQLYRISDTPNLQSKKSHSKKITSKVNITKSDNCIDVSKEGTHRLPLKHKRRSCFTRRKWHKALKKGDEAISGQSNDYNAEHYLEGGKDSNPSETICNEHENDDHVKSQLNDNRKEVAGSGNGSNPSEMISNQDTNDQNDNSEVNEKKNVSGTDDTENEAHSASDSNAVDVVTEDRCTGGKGKSEDGSLTNPLFTIVEVGDIGNSQVSPKSTNEMNEQVAFNENNSKDILVAQTSDNNGSVDDDDDIGHVYSTSTEMYLSDDDTDERDSKSSVVQNKDGDSKEKCHNLSDNSSDNSKATKGHIESNAEQEVNNTPPEENVNNEQNVMEKPVQEKAIDPKSNKQRPEIKSFKTPMKLKRENQIMPPLSKRQRNSKLLVATYSAKHIEKGNDGRFHCDICHRHYKEKKTLNAHIKVHFQSGAYNCSHCDRNFHNKNEFRRHEASHIDERLYACARCGKCFKTVENLRVHVHKCQVGKPLSKVEYINCSHCKKDFTSQESL